MNISRIYDIFRQHCDGKLTTDTRKITGGELFVALKGENFDGNKFVGKALELGAQYAVADESCEESDPRIIRVKDTLQTLWDLASYHREHIGIATLGENGALTGGRRLTVIGLTGTNGKTTTKELIRCVLATKYSVAATEGNLNNNIGVPLTLLVITEDHEIALVEMGASHPGDIETLVKVCHPDIGLITNVGRAHLLGFGSFEGVKKTKGELYDYILAARSATHRVFLNADNPHLQEMADERPGLETIPYGVSFNGVEILPADAGHPFLRMRIPDRTISGGGASTACTGVPCVEVDTHLVGAYNADNVMAALAVGEYFGISLRDGAAAIGAYIPSNNRSMMQKTGRNLLIVDAYNANPSSMDVALDNFSSVVADSKLALLGAMRELGDESAAEHARIAAKARAIPGAKVFLVGEEFGPDMDFATSEELAAFLGANPVSGATVLIKGSRGIRMETVIPVL